MGWPGLRVLRVLSQALEERLRQSHPALIRRKDVLTSGNELTLALATEEAGKAITDRSAVPLSNGK